MPLTSILLFRSPSTVTFQRAQLNYPLKLDILLDHHGVIKFVDFGAAKILAKNQRSIQRSRRASDAGGGGLMRGNATNNSLTGTPMYMSPEVIRNNKRGRHGAMDVWSLGCVVLECATGRKPWSNLDNEWSVPLNQIHFNFHSPSFSNRTFYFCSVLYFTGFEYVRAYLRSLP